MCAFPSSKRYAWRLVDGNDCHPTAARMAGGYISQAAAGKRTWFAFERDMIHASGVLAPTGPPRADLTESVYKVVLQKSILTQTRQLVLYYYWYKE